MHSFIFSQKNKTIKTPAVNRFVMIACSFLLNITSLHSYIKHVECIGKLSKTHLKWIMRTEYEFTDDSSSKH